MRRPEQTLQRAVVQYLDAVLPATAWCFHAPNGGGRSKVEAAIFKGLGVRAGIPDICILYDGRAFWIELKAAKGRLSEAQERAHVRLWEAGCPVADARSLDDVRRLLVEEWAIPTREARAAA